MQGTSIWLYKLPLAVKKEMQLSDHFPNQFSFKKRYTLPKNTI